MALTTFMSDEEIKQIPKRVVIKPGDVYCAEFDNRFKCYFQYVIQDTQQLHSNVIRVFKTHHPIDYCPTIGDIVNDEVAFYTHALIWIGVKSGAWYKVGKCPDTNSAALENIIFGYSLDSKFVLIRPTMVNALENWRIWKANQPYVVVDRLPEKYHGIIELGSVKAYNEIRSRMEYGYYKYSDLEYDIIKRHPRPEADSYTKRDHEGATYYYHFRGEYVVREVAMAVNEAVRLTPDNPVSGRYHLYMRPFGDINWRYREFITAEEFNQVWNFIKT
ncbi:hypothetical protein [uncultured Muribaculum sp.]|uniref:hypothetical protein n=1 Tax=uncultured Muribaculum sp. TaxID=1918613 RepID=UPI0025AF8441|nr:hypothetical protein [uncultured Muribaculum sp.]